MTDTKPPTYTRFVPDLAAHLATKRIGQYRPNGVYKTYSPPAIYFGALPDEAGYAIALNVYNFITRTGRDTATPAVYVQVRARGDKHPHSPAEILDKVYQELHEHTNYTLDNSTRVLLSTRHLRGPEEKDTQGRWTRADSYTFTLNPQGE